MSYYERLYKCRLRDQIFSEDCTDCIKVSPNSPLGRILAASGVAYVRTSNITATYYMHYCDDELSGAADLVGVRKVDDHHARR